MRYAIVGTANSWKRTPWTDPGLRIASLNDAYQLKGFVRADEWFDFHPLDRFFHPDGKMIYAHQVPAGYYCRPKDHLAWLAKQQIPVWLHPDYATQHPDAVNWPSARALPRAAIEAHFGEYFTSSPALMLAKAVMDGYRDVSIYGIHLATEHEYLEQRPNFEFLIGCVLGAGKRTITVKDGMRHYESPDGHIALPEESPVLQGDFRYAWDVRPAAKLEPVKWELHKLQTKHTRRLDALKTHRWWNPWVTYAEPADDGTPFPRTVRTSTVQQEILYLEAAIDDRRQELMRLQVGG